MTSSMAGEAPATGLDRAPGVATEPQPAAPPPPREPWALLSLLVVLGGISAIAYYFGFVRPYLLQEYYLRPLLDLAKINGRTASAANAWALTWIVLFACYYIAFRACPSALNMSRTFRRTALTLICGWAAFFNISLVFMYPVGAADLFDQIFRARLLAKYNLNPFLTVPESVQGDPFQPYVAWKGDPSPYGPIWETLAAGTSGLAGDSLWRNLILFKLLVMLAYGISVALVYATLRARKPEWALKGTLFFAWNPLVLFEIAGNGHNDAFVGLFLLLAVYLLVKAWHSTIFVALMAGALTKFVPLVLVPVAAAAVWRDRLATRHPRDGDDEPGILSRVDAFTNIAVGGLLSLGLAAIMYARFWDGPESVGALSRQTLFTASIPKVILDAMVNRAGFGAGEAQAIVRNTALTLVLATVVAFSVRILLVHRHVTTPARRAALVESTLSAFYEIIFVYLAFATLWFQPWYLIWLVALTAPLARMANAHRTLLFCIGGVANYFVWDFIWLWNRTSNQENQVTSALVIYTLPLLYTVYTLLKPMWARGEAALDR